MFDDREDRHAEFATMTDSVREWAYAVGGDSPDVAWLLHDYDVWTPNPHYHGPREPHPEVA